MISKGRGANFLDGKHPLAYNLHNSAKREICRFSIIKLSFQLFWLYFWLVSR